MAVVNNILNKVSLNTAKYNENLQKMRKKTKTETKEMGAAFKAMGNVWAAVAGAISAGALGNAIVKELKATETAVAGFINTAGGVEQARATFEMLQQAARDTLQPFDALRAAAQDLQRNGIAPSAEQLKTFSQIAVSSGKSLETVTASFTAALQGRFKALTQLGITAQDMGDKLALTYKGTTTEIEKNSAALAGYFEKIGEENRGALDYLQNGMTGALNHLDNAWGDFVRSIAESGLGQAIADTIRVGANALDGFTQWINNNKQPIQNFFNAWSDYIKRLGNDFQQLQRDMESWFQTSEKINGKGTEEKTPGFLGWITSLSQTAGEKYFELFNGSDAERQYKYQKQQILDVFKRKMSGYKKGSEEYQKLIEQQNDAIVELEKKFSDKQTTVFGRVLKFFDPEDTAAKLVKFSDEYTEYLEEADRKRKEFEDGLKGTGEGTDGIGDTVLFGSQKGTKSAFRALTDSWRDYYNNIMDLQKSAMSDREKIDAEYFSKLAELQEQAGKSQTATAEEINTVRELLEAEHAQKIKELREQALTFYTDVIGNEEQQIRESYSRKIEDLEAFHADQLLSETEFLEARNALYEQYNAEVTAFKKRQKEGGSYFFSKEEQQQVAEFSDGMNSLSDVFQNLTDSMSQSGAKYKALFAIQKAFAVASATANAILAWSQALSDTANPTWIGKLAAYANAVALTTGIITQLKGVEMHDRGGHIGAGKIGIVGEFGPELVTGPATVTSRKDTADLARSALNGNGVQVNLYEDASRAGTVDASQGMDGEQVINIFVSNIRRGGRMAQAMESTYQLHRYGGA